VTAFRGEKRVKRCRYPAWSEKKKGSMTREISLGAKKDKVPFKDSVKKRRARTRFQKRQALMSAFHEKSMRRGKRGEKKGSGGSHMRKRIGSRTREARSVRKRARKTLGHRHRPESTTSAPYEKPR